MFVMLGTDPGCGCAWGEAEGGKGGNHLLTCAGGGADLTSLRGEEMCGGGLSSLAGSAHDSRKPSPGLSVRWGGAGNSSNVRRVPGTCKRVFVSSTYKIYYSLL